MQKERKINKKIIIIALIIICIIIGIVVFLVTKNDGNENVDNVENQPDSSNQSTEVSSETEENKLSMPEKMGNYAVMGEIEIPKIGVKKYILESTDDESLKLSVTRFWGKGVNEIGNFSIIGHNYAGVFKDLAELVKGDTFVLTSTNGSVRTYVIYDIFIVEPDDVSCIEDTLPGKREVTLITCTPGGEKRLILKAEEQN